MDETAKTIAGLSKEQIERKIHGAKIIFLYPWTTHRNVFLSYMLEQTDYALLYYRLKDSEETLTGWFKNLIIEFRKNYGDFGHRLEASLESDDPASWALSLALDLNLYAQRNGMVYFFCDEIDRIPHDEMLKSFFRELVSNVNDRVKVVISSRLLRYQPWLGFIGSGAGTVLTTEINSDQALYNPQGQSKPTLETYALGRGYGIVNGQTINNWDGALPRNLFFYFVDHPLITRDQIFEVFWPRLATKDATNVFHVTKRKISERITMKIENASESYELTQYSSGYYIPSNKFTRFYDVHEFQATMDQSMVVNNVDEEEKLLQQAIDLYRGPFLQDGKMDWMDTRRDELKYLYAQALIGIGRIRKNQGKKMVALGFFIRALKEIPEREDVHREVMQIYTEAGMYQDALEQYQILARTLDRTLGVSPSRETRSLHDLIRTQI
jgi:two-component SAPR family response regulator